MGFFEITTVVMLILGMLAHIVTKVIGEKEYETIGFVDTFKTYVSTNPVQMLFSVVFTFVFVVSYVESGGLPLTLDLPGIGVNPNVMLSAFFTGYLIDSISRNVRKMFETKVKNIR